MLDVDGGVMSTVEQQVELQVSLDIQLSGVLAFVSPLMSRSNLRRMLVLNM